MSRFQPDFADANEDEELLAKRGIIVSYETIRQWLKRRLGRLGDVWYLDEVFVNIQGQRHYTGA